MPGMFLIYLGTLGAFDAVFRATPLGVNRRAEMELLLAILTLCLGVTMLR